MRRLIYRRGMSGVVDYDERWPVWFAAVRSALPPGLVVEHVGSTAVPGVAAKPIIDVDVVVASVDDVAPAVAALVAAGWQHEGDLGIPGREAFEPRADLPPHHLYVVVRDSAAHLDHVDLRDYLRTHPSDARRYGALKRELAPLLSEDREAYLAGKSDLVAELLAAARAGGGDVPWE